MAQHECKAGCKAGGGVDVTQRLSWLGGGQSRRCHLAAHGRGVSSSGAPGGAYALQLQPGSPLKLSSLQAHRSMALPRVRVGSGLSCLP